MEDFIFYYRFSVLMGSECEFCKVFFTAKIVTLVCSKFTSVARANLLNSNFYSLTQIKRNFEIEIYRKCEKMFKV